MIMVFQSLSYVIALVFLINAIIDLLPIFKDWMQRIRIGRYQDFSLWSKAIMNRGSNWLCQTPKIKVTDNSRLILIDMIKGNYTKSAIQYWQEAALLLGLLEHLKYHDHEEINKNIKRFLSIKFNEHGQWKEQPQYIDSAILAYAVLNIKDLDSEKYKKAFDYTWELIKEHIGKDGTVGYRKSMQSYRYVDTIGFICPFLVSYGIRYGKNECIELAVKQIKEYEQFGVLPEHNIPCHAYEIEKKVPLGLYGWGRGVGWFAIGLIDAWNELPQNHRCKPVLEESVRRFSKVIMEFQQSNGSWNWTVTRKESRPDSSATATLSWFLLNAAKIDDISKECIASTEKAISYLMKVTRRNGAVDFSQGDTKDIGVY